VGEDGYMELQYGVNSYGIADETVIVSVEASVAEVMV
jgi:hypothetical protein